MRFRLWSRKSRTDPQKIEDPNALGRLMREQGLLTDEQLARALEFKRDNPDVLLGEVLILLGVSTRQTVERALFQQKARRAEHNPRSRETTEVLRYAAEHTRKAAETRQRYCMSLFAPREDTSE